MFRSPEVEWRGPHIATPIDMWVVGVVAIVMAGVLFTEVRDDLSLPQRWNRYLGEPPQELGFSSAGDVGYLPLGRWPAQLVTAMGRIGILLLVALLTYELLQRLTAAELIDHAFLHDGLFPLVGVRSDGVMLDGQGTPDKTGPEDSDLLKTILLLPGGRPGHSIINDHPRRHDCSIRAWVIQRDLLLWMRKDDMFIEGTPANKLVVQLATGNKAMTRDKQKPRSHISLDGAKVRVASNLGTRTGVTMIALSTKDPCALARVTDFMKAFFKVNMDCFLAMQSKANAGARRLGPTR